MLVLTPSVNAQTRPAGLFWDYPITLSEGRFHLVQSGEELMFLVWQDTVATNSGFDTYLSMAVSADGRIWRRFERFAGPFPFAARGKEVKIFDIAVTENDVCYIAIAESTSVTLIYKTDLMSRDVRLLKRFDTPSTTVSPRIYIGGDNTLRLFVIKDARITDDGVETPGANAAAIFYSISPDGSEWSAFSELVGAEGEDEVVRQRLQLLPDFVAAFDREYIVFPVFSGEADSVSTQLYLKTSDDNGRTWSDSDLISDFRDPTLNFTYTQIDNQGPRLAELENSIGLVWERGLLSGSSNVFFLEINPDGTISKEVEQITRRRKDHRRPQLFRYDGVEYILWFDNSAGIDHVKLARKIGTLWVDVDLTAEIPGRSSFGVINAFEGEAFVFFEHYDGSRYTISYLKPDESMRSPDMRAFDFAENNRYRRDQFTVRWSEPPDSSEIIGYSISVDRDPDAAPIADATIPATGRKTTVSIEEDGLWHIHVSAGDAAGNWSEPATVAVFRDTTPPEPVTFHEPDTDDFGYLASNTYTLSWDPPRDDDIAGYSYSFQYLYALGQKSNMQTVSLRRPTGRVLSTFPTFGLRNIDNGLWALSVSPIDTVGNRGQEQVLFIHTDKYIPVTFITGVTTEQDDLGRLNLTVTGRGFSVGGITASIIFDRDRREPYDFIFDRDSDLYTVKTDRILYGAGIPGIDEGDYYVGVVHPTRGTHFGRNTIAVAPTGQVKFGDFQAYRPIPLLILHDSKYAVPINIAIFLLIVAILVFVVLFSSHRMVAVAREARVIRGEVRALLTGELTAAERKERVKAMKRKGLGLRLKFALFTISIVISIVLIVSLPLGITMTGTQERLLAQGLQDQTDVLLESLRAGAENFLPDAFGDDIAATTAKIQLNLLPRQMDGVPDARYVTITGQAAIEKNDDNTTYQPDGYDFVWTQNDPAIRGRIDTLEFVRGRSQLTDDPISQFIPEIESRINAEANQAVGDLPTQLQTLIDERVSLLRKITTDVLSTTQAERERFTELEPEIETVQGQLYDELAKLDTQSDVYPEFNVESLDRENTEYTFYKPIVYAQTGEDIYFRGLVRVAITTEPIIGKIIDARNQILFTTGIISLIAVAIGIIGALVLSTIIIIPIRTLLRGVEMIRDTEDKEDLKSHVIKIKTKDEISDLASAVNQMTQGLAAAASANKDLILGKDTQKMFVPLEQDPSSGRKLTTAYDVNEHAEFFGYYEGAKGVSGDYFDFTRLDAKHYAIIKCDVAGKGVPASLIMVEVATIFLDNFRNWTLKEDGFHLDRLAYRINDLVEQRGFKGRFAAFMLCILNIETGAAHFCHAGDKYIHVYDAAEHKVLQEEFPESPAAGVFPSDLVEMGTGFIQVQRMLKKNDTLLLFTDGVEEDKRHFRDAEGNYIVCEEPGVGEGEQHETHVGGEESEELGIPRIHEVINAVFDRSTYRLQKYHNPDPDERFDFDFTGCEGTVREAVLAMAAVDKVFRVYKPANPGRQNRVRVDTKIDEFLKKHFRQYEQYFREPVNDELLPEYVYFPFLAEDDQYDDLTILGIRKL